MHIFQLKMSKNLKIVFAVVEKLVQWQQNGVLISIIKQMLLILYFCPISCSINILFVSALCKCTIPTAN